jgi:hypothetical protein
MLFILIILHCILFFLAEEDQSSIEPDETYNTELVAIAVIIPLVLLGLLLLLLAFAILIFCLRNRLIGTTDNLGEEDEEKWYCASEKSIMSPKMAGDVETVLKGESQDKDKNANFDYKIKEENKKSKVEEKVIISEEEKIVKVEILTETGEVEEHRKVEELKAENKRMKEKKGESDEVRSSDEDENKRK